MKLFCDLNKNSKIIKHILLTLVEFNAFRYCIYAFFIMSHFYDTFIKVVSNSTNMSYLSCLNVSENHINIWFAKNKISKMITKVTLIIVQQNYSNNSGKINSEYLKTFTCTSRGRKMIYLKSVTTDVSYSKRKNSHVHITYKNIWTLFVTRKEHQ